MTKPTKSLEAKANQARSMLIGDTASYVQDTPEVVAMRERVAELEREVERQTTLKEMHARYQADAERDRDRAISITESKADAISAQYGHMEDLERQIRDLTKIGSTECEHLRGGYHGAIR